MIFDLHNDILTHKSGIRKKSTVIKSYKCAKNLDTVVFVIWTSKFVNTAEDIQRCIDFTEKIFTGHQSPPVFAIEDMSFAAYTNIDFLLERSDILYCGLTWNYENKLAGGAESSGRLTETGKTIIKELESSNIIIDTAHLNEESFWDVAEYSCGPIINSHTCFSGVCRHRRNINDDQIKAIAERGGIIGLTMVPYFLSPGKCDMDSIIRHIDYFTGKFGHKALALGTDFYGVDILPENVKNYKAMAKIHDKLAKLGYTNDEIKCIFYKNAQDFMKNARNGE